MAQKKRQRILERRLHLADRIIAAALTTSTILPPFSVYAADSNIKAKGDWTTVKTSGSKHTVTTNKKDGDKAFNRFSNFELAEGHVANMVLPSGVKKRESEISGWKRPFGNWTVPREIDKKKSTCRRNASNYVALLRISYGVRPFFMVILS